MEVTQGLRYKNHIRIKSESNVRNQKLRSNYVWKIHQSYILKITLELSQEVTLDLRRKLINKTIQMGSRKYVIIA